jgi:hypothetical protein
MPFADTTRKNVAEGTGVGSLNVTLNSTVSGNLVVAGSAVYNGSSSAPNSAITDGSGNSYTQSFTRSASSGTDRLETGLSYSVLTTGGNLTITCDPGASTYDMTVFVHEFSGPHATPTSGTPVTNAGTTETTADTTAFTPADADALYIAVLTGWTWAAITENVAPGSTDWNLSNENESSPGNAGSMVWFIRSGAAASRRAAWTVTSGFLWTAGIAGFKKSADAPPAYRTSRVGFLQQLASDEDDGPFNALDVRNWFRQRVFA